MHMYTHPPTVESPETGPLDRLALEFKREGLVRKLQKLLHYTATTRCTQGQHTLFRVGTYI